MLKVGFTPCLGRSQATYEIPFGSIERVADGREVPALQWADLSDEQYGISILSDTKHGFDANGNTLRMTMIRTSYEPDPVPDCGTHSFTYSLYPHSGTWREANTVRRGNELNFRLHACLVKGKKGKLPYTKSFLDVRSPADNVVLTCMKKAEKNGDLIVRVYESKGMQTRVTIKFGFSVKKVEEVDLVERPCGFSKGESLGIESCGLNPIDVKGSQFDFKISPYEIRTFRLRH